MKDDDYSQLSKVFHPVILFPSMPVVLDLTETTLSQFSDEPYTIGRFNEERKNLYAMPLFNLSDQTLNAQPRSIHMGVDLGAPSGTPIFSFDRGEVWSQGALPREGDYGHSIVISYIWSLSTPLSCGQEMIQRGDRYWALYGHLSAESVSQRGIGDSVKAGEQIAWLGNQRENGGWPPHLHFQLSRVPPVGCDLPGVVSVDQHEQALNCFPDPRWVLGSIY